MKYEKGLVDMLHENNKKKSVPSAESFCSVWGLGKGVSGKPYPRLCNARRLRLEPGTFRSQAVRLYRLHQTHPSFMRTIIHIIVPQTVGEQRGGGKLLGISL